MRHVRRSVCLLSLTVLLAALVACKPTTGPKQPPLPGETVKIRIGVQPIEAALPIWVAEEAGLFKKAGLDAKVEVFESATDRNTALLANAIDCTQADPISIGLLEKGGFPVSATTILLGATPQEGRDGIVARPGLKARTLSDLAGVPVGTSLDTHQEFIVDSLFAEAGIPKNKVKKEEVKKTPIRYELLMEGKLDAAALPEPWLTLAVFKGGTLVADDTKGANISQELLIGSDKWLATAEGAEAMKRLLGVLNEAATLIDKNPEAWRQTLIDNSGVPQELQKAYPVPTFPGTQLPTEEMLGSQMQWMVGKGLLDTPLPYDRLVWRPTN